MTQCGHLECSEYWTWLRAVLSKLSSKCSSEFIESG